MQMQTGYFQKAQEQQYASGNLGAAAMPDYPSPPTEQGIISTVKELLEAVNITAGAANEIQYSLGISQPVPEQNSKNPESPSLVQVLRSAIYRLHETNGRLQQTIKHINS